MSVPPVSAEQALTKQQFGDDVSHMGPLSEYRKAQTFLSVPPDARIEREKWTCPGVRGRLVTLIYPIFRTHNVKCGLLPRATPWHSCADKERAYPKLY